MCPAGERCDAGACVPCSEEERGCAGKVCGPDLCGGSCGTCDVAAFCVAPDPDPPPAPGPSLAPGVVGTCAPCVCGECGLSGCGYACGTCAPGFVCADGSCVACAPDCVDKACGPDGCGGTCGTCQPWEWCTTTLSGAAYCDGGT